MEAGPSLLFTDAELTITAEDPLPEGFDKLDLSGLDDVDTELGDLERTFNTGLTFLQNDALSWQADIDGISGFLGDLQDNFPADIDQGILDNVPNSQAAIDGAESSFLPDAYNETYPTYTDTGGGTPSAPVRSGGPSEE